MCPSFSIFHTTGMTLSLQSPNYRTRDSNASSSGPLDCTAIRWIYNPSGEREKGGGYAAGGGRREEVGNIQNHLGTHKLTSLPRPLAANRKRHCPSRPPASLESGPGSVQNDIPKFLYTPGYLRCPPPPSPLPPSLLPSPEGRLSPLRLP